ncbi:unnamed protein product, partial [Prorocentrum cordatum]
MNVSAFMMAVRRGKGRTDLLRDMFSELASQEQRTLALCGTVAPDEVLEDIEKAVTCV